MSTKIQCDGESTVLLQNFLDALRSWDWEWSGQWSSTSVLHREAHFAKETSGRVGAACDACTVACRGLTAKLPAAFDSARQLGMEFQIPISCHACIFGCSDLFFPPLRKELTSFL
jgi:hypothetical protein